MTSREELLLDGVHIELVRKRIKNIYVRVLQPLGQARISAPLRMSDAAVREFAQSKLEWIRAHQERMRKGAARESRAFAEGDEIPLWGRPRQVCCFPVGGARRVFVRGDRIDMHVRAADSPDLRRRLWETLLRREMAREVPRLLALWRPILGVPMPRRVFVRGDRIDMHVRAADGPDLRRRLWETLLRREMAREVPRLLALWRPILGVPMPEFSLRRMRTRWGSCSPTTRRLRFALHLAEKPPHFLEYVVVHELVHLLECSHNERFTAYMDLFLPQWRTVRREMRAAA